MISTELMKALRAKAAELGFADIATTLFWRKHVENMEQSWESATAAIMLAMPYSYYLPPPEGVGQISAYYPASHRAYLGAKALAEWLREKGFAAYEASRIPMKLFAKAAGLGSPGRNSLLQSRNNGSAVALQAIITDAPISIDSVSKPSRPILSKTCGKCRECLKTCPVGVLPAAEPLVRTKCLRNHTNGRLVPHELRPLMGVRLCGCDICGECCPANAGKKQPFPDELTELLSIRELLSDAPEQMSARMLRLGKLVGGNMANPARFRSQAALAAASTRAEGVHEALLPLLTCDNAVTRAHAAYSLLRHGDVEAVKRAISAEQDADTRADMETSLKIHLEAVRINE